MCWKSWDQERGGHTKCLRSGCQYRKHAQQRHGYCCNGCCERGQHGQLCERVPYHAPSSDGNAAAAATPSASSSGVGSKKEPAAASSAAASGARGGVAKRSDAAGADAKVGSSASAARRARAHGASSVGPPLKSSLACARPTCGYLRHTRQDHGFCCNYCRDN
mmetsp:Transcript_64621/g.166301  ORF Transcript_64621/g.166301 Transcript_64621/m.166301 type:complete len:163 (-) Transcript_64621:2-490(-)